MQDVSNVLNTGLLIMVNIIGGLILGKINEIKTYGEKTREKLDHHVENFEMHLVGPNKSHA